MDIIPGRVATVGLATLVALSTMLATTARPACPAAVTVRVTAPLYESPGALVPAIVTAYHPPAGSAAFLAAVAGRGAGVTCLGAPWYNPIQRSVSRQCYLALPATPGPVDLVGTALFVRAGAAAVTRSASGRAVTADGYRTSTMSIATARQIERCYNTTPYVRLTFDDGGSDHQVRSILATLRRNNVRGTFFFRGDWAATHPSLLRLITSQGHWVANHSYSHPALSRISDARVVRQVDAGISATTEPELLRPPFGAGAFSTRLVRLAAERGYKLCRWTTDTFDWDDQTPAAMAQRVAYGDYLSPPVAAGGVILMHGTGRYTAAGLQRIIDAVRSRHLSLQPLHGTDPQGGRPPAAAAGHDGDRRSPTSEPSSRSASAASPSARACG